MRRKDNQFLFLQQFSKENLFSSFYLRPYTRNPFYFQEASTEITAPLTLDTADCDEPWELWMPAAISKPSELALHRVRVRGRGRGREFQPQDEVAPGGGQMPPQLVAIVVPFVRRMRTTLLLRRIGRLRRTDSTPPGSPNDEFHHVPGVWIVFGTWWTAFDSNIHFDNWQRAFVSPELGSPLRFYSVQRLTVTTIARAPSASVRPASVRGLARRVRSARRLQPAGLAAPAVSFSVDQRRRCRLVEIRLKRNSSPDAVHVR